MDWQVDVCLCLYMCVGVDTVEGLFELQQYRGSKKIRRAVIRHLSDLLILGG